jgi:general secretion pathway protein D/MSHA biogenesis protein MshL
MLLLLFATSCGNKQQPVVIEEPVVPTSQPQAEAPMPEKEMAPAMLPVMYQNPAYMVDSDEQEDMLLGDTETVLKVGATIKSTRGPQPLWDILKRIASLKKMNVSWASDVDQNVLVDVDINANDDFYGAIDNLLRQVDYFHEMQGNTIVVKYKEVRQFRVAMPFVSSNYATGTGGNVLGSNEASANVDGTIELKSMENTFDIWENIRSNMDQIIELWNTVTIGPETISMTEGSETAIAASQGSGGRRGAGTGSSASGREGESISTQATRQVSQAGAAYFIDKPVGIITVTAPRPLLDELQRYFDSLTKEIYKQISIEAKIIEVQLTDNSYIGINWDQVLRDFEVSGTVFFGGDGTNGADEGQVWPYVFSNDREFDDGTNHGNVYDPTRFISKLTLGAADFSVFLNALEQQGDTNIISSPRLSVLNGQPSLLTAGRNVTYIEKIESDVDSGSVNSIRTYTVETARILSGIGLALTATILNDEEIIMNLVPVTSVLEEPIEYRTVGLEGGEVGLPVVNVREMSTTVRVKDGEMLIIGGLISEVTDNQGSFAPVVGKIPLVRYLFGYEEKVHEKRELVILLKPKII